MLTGVMKCLAVSLMRCPDSLSRSTCSLHGQAEGAGQPPKTLWSAQVRHRGAQRGEGLQSRNGHLHLPHRRALPLHGAHHRLWKSAVCFGEKRGESELSGSR